ncbi:hypothetical protein ACU0OL_003701 [Citrobacter koseri]
MRNFILSALIFIPFATIANETELTKLKEKASPTESEIGVKHCDLSTFNIVGGKVVYEDTFEKEAVVVDHGKSFSINASIYNVDSPSLMYNFDNDEMIVLSANSGDFSFSRVRELSDDSLTYRLTNEATKRVFFASNCEQD